MKKGSRVALKSSPHIILGEVTSCTTGNQYTLYEKGCRVNGNWYRNSHLVEITTKQLEHLKSIRRNLDGQIKNIQKEIIEVDAKIDFMVSNNIEEFDETQFKAYRILQLTKDENLSDLEKSKLIAELVNSKII